MMGAFADWRKKTATIKKYTTTVNAAGVPQQAESTVKANVRVNYWMEKSVETNINDKFVDQATGMVVLPSNLTVDTTMWMEIDSKKHYITGVDDVGGFGEVLLVSWRRQYA